MKKYCITNAKKWIIYANGIGGWFAWNGYTRKRKDLIFVGTFSKAINVFEKRLALIMILDKYYKKLDDTEVFTVIES